MNMVLMRDNCYYAGSGFNDYNVVKDVLVSRIAEATIFRVRLQDGALVTDPELPASSDYALVPVNVVEVDR